MQKSARSVLGRSFQNENLLSLPIQKLKSCFPKTSGRPTKKLYTMLGVSLLQQPHDLTDEETISQLAFDIQWHYAFNLTEESDSAKYLSLEILWTFRQLMIEKKLDTVLFKKKTSKLVQVFQVNTDHQRIDSVHIKFNMRRLGRIRFF